MNKKILASAILILIIIAGCAKQLIKVEPYDYTTMDKATKKAHESVEKFLIMCFSEKYPVEIPRNTRIDSIKINETEKHLDIYLNSLFAYIPFREENTVLVYDAMRDKLGGKFKDYTFKIYSKEFPIETLIPNFYRSDKTLYDYSRMPKSDNRSLPIIMNINKPWYPKNGLFNRNIALWHSHGWYYEQSLNRWEFQRARLFQSVEDLGPIAFTIPYIIPMLENAGANVFLPRERDFQIYEIIVDNDSYSDENAEYYDDVLNDTLIWKSSADSTGFAIGNPPYETGDNPFKTGTYRIIQADTNRSALAFWAPTIPENGEYAVYISYAASDSCVTDAHYTVYHTGGSTVFIVNQQIGGNTWLYLGKFKFNAGYDPDYAGVMLSNKSQEFGKYITADAVRFGGGMGNVARNGMVSGRPRFIESARYYLQYAGIPDTMVYSLHDEQDDYKDDYRSRGEWVNYLKGAPFGPNKDRNMKGLGIPVDLSLSFHTDAGITNNDTVIGTLAIYSTESEDSILVFPDSVSRLANRDLADILQTQIVNDILSMWDPAWTRRSLWDKKYSEACRPNVPSVLLELLSHQNFLDMKFFHDPNFRFDVSRSIYKSILKYLATNYQYDYIVQPLPVSHFQATFNDSGAILLKWQPTTDPLEETATAKKYIVYTRIEDNNFDNGILVDESQYIMKDIKPYQIYSFKVTAVNDGGESFPSEILSVCRMNGSVNPVLIINGFDRVAAPATLESDKYVGFANFWDQGVPDRYDLGFTGTQFNFSPASKWTDDDSPGHGASYANYETSVIAGNTFDFPFIHGKSIASAGYSFVSVSDEVVMDDKIDITKYKIVDLILGEEKQTDWPKPDTLKRFKAFPQDLQKAVTKYCKSGGNLFISGAYIGTDLFEQQPIDSTDIKFATDVLKYKWRTNYAAKTGKVWSINNNIFDSGYSFQFNTELNKNIYCTEAPDGIEPADSTSNTILWYNENNISAGIAYNGENYKVIAFGFPFETILTQESRDKVMRSIFNYFN